MNKKMKSLLAVSLIGVLAFPACKEKAEYEMSEDLFVALENASIERFSKTQLELGVGVKEVTWSSSDESVAIVENGELIGLKAGTAVLSAVRGEERQEQAITVVEGETPAIDVDYLPVMRGYSYEIDVKALFNGVELEDATFTCSVADTSVATLENEVLSGVAYGETTVTISMSWHGQENVVTKTVPCVVTKNVAVYTDRAEYVLYSMSSVLGEPFAVEAQIQPTVFYEGEQVDGLSFTWESADTNIATIDASGKVSAVACGETYVVGKCEHGGETLSTRKVPVKVEKPHLKTKVNLPIKVGSTEALFDPAKTLGEGYTVGKLLDMTNDTPYTCTDNTADLSSLLTGEYTFLVTPTDESFSTEINVIIADFLVSTKEDLTEAMGSLNAYVVLLNDLDAGSWKNPQNTQITTVYEKCTFNGLGHTLTITYPSSKKSLYTVLRDSTIKNLAVKATITATNNTGGLYRANRGNVTIDNCYVETTIANDNATKVGGIADQAYGVTQINISNTIVKVHDLDRTDFVTEQCGALFGTWTCPSVKMNNAYVISNAGTLASVANSSLATTVNKQKGILYKTDAAFVEAKNNNKVVVDTFNHYWDLSSDVPQFKA